MVKPDSYGSIKTMLSEIVDNVMNRISIAAEGPSLSSTAASSCHGKDGASTDVSLIGSPIQSNRGRKRRREDAWKYPHLVKIFYDYEEDFVTLNLNQTKSIKHEVPNPKNISPKQLRQTEASIDRAKYNDLMELCNLNLIPPVHHSFFKNFQVKVENIILSGVTVPH
ncbi:hypothetical protein PoB_004451000 [Plakobranchus ocellatus]|uniref:Uncharacterized protein n=1 Tax=Plakobranchus ocellatus TaxID=259542 RepID=A0AAV4BEL7_9GAST|nr:hypothetical protein PoB_004451000 [Plakobranchus ocellatus]